MFMESAKLTRNTLLRLTPALYERLRWTAYVRQMSMQACVRCALDAYLEQTAHPSHQDREECP
jgi:hypothetical protein